MSHFFSRFQKQTEQGSIWLRKPGRTRRPFSVLDGFAYGVYADSIIIAAALTYSLLWPWPDANIPLGIVMVCLAFLPMFTVYAMLTTLMPRVGGDYMWQSRTLGGFWGFVLIFTPLLFGPWFYMASNVAPGSAMAVTPVLISLAEILDMPVLVDAGIYISTRAGTWWFYVFYVTLAALILLLGMRLYAKIQRYSFAIGCIALLTWTVALLLTSQAEFEKSFSDFMLRTLQWGEGDAFREILALAEENGFNAVPLSQTRWGSSFLIGPALAYTFMYIAWTGTLVGEIKGVDRFKNSAKIFLGGNIFAMLTCAGFTWLLISRISNEFFTSSNFLWASGTGEHIPISPHLGLFIMALSDNPWFWLWVAVGLNCWFWIWPTNNMVMSTRVMFAMSADRMLPSVVTRISKRWGTPVVAIGICYFGSLVMGWLYFFTGFAKLTLDMPFMTSIAFAASTLAGTLFPVLKSTRKLYESSPVSRYKVFGIPLIMVSGTLGLIYFAIIFTLYISDNRYGTNDPLSALFITGSIVLSALAYLGYSHLRKQRGTDMSKILKVIPTE